MRTLPVETQPLPETAPSPGKVARCRRGTFLNGAHGRKACAPTSRSSQEARPRALNPVHVGSTPTSATGRHATAQPGSPQPDSLRRVAAFSRDDAEIVRVSTSHRVWPMPAPGLLAFVPPAGLECPIWLVVNGRPTCKCIYDAHADSKHDFAPTCTGVEVTPDVEDAIEAYYHGPARGRA